jgi:PAS domain S-box-containing protein
LDAARILEALPLPVLRTDADHVVQSGNAALARMVGRRPDGGRLDPPPSGPRWQGRLRLPGGASVALEAAATPAAGGGHVLAVLPAGTVPLEEAQAVSGTGSWEYSAASGRTELSREMLRIYGYDPDQPRPADAQLASAVLPEDRARLRSAMAPGGPDESAVDYRIRRSDGEVRSLQSQRRVVRDAEGAAVRVVGTVRDVTEHRRRAGEASEAERLRLMDEFRARFINVAAHELKTPMTPIVIHLDLLEALLGADAPPGQLKAVRAARKGMARLQKLVEDVLDAARVQAVQLRTRREPVDLAEVLAEAIERHDAQARSKGIRLLVECAGPTWLHGDSDRLLQVVTNLISNALKFTPAGGIVRVRLDQAPNETILQVSDTGRGLTTAQRDRLFQPFTQVHGQEASNGGSGLGLYITHGIIGEHGGAVAVDSPGPDQGATFTVRLPNSPPPEAAQ